MAHQIDMIIDLQYGSTGKGLIAGYLAKREEYDTVVCAFAPNAGHRYVDAGREIDCTTQQLPTAALSSKTIKNVLIGPGALISPKILQDEIKKYGDLINNKNILIHPHAAIVEPYHVDDEIESGMTKIGSTAKGVGAAMIERIQRQPKANTAYDRLVMRNHPLGRLVVTADEYRDAVIDAQSVLIEGAQGFSLSLYHGQYPYVTSRDVTPWQIAADCGLPFKWASYIQIIGTMRTYPIRVNNRDGSSGPCYPDQREISWDDIGVEPELTTVTKLPRRIFTFSRQQTTEALIHCASYWKTRIFLNFANYCKNNEELNDLVREIERPVPGVLNTPHVTWLGFGPDDDQVESA